MVKKSGQYQIQQMAFMILAIFLFFVLVGLFFVGWQYTNMKQDFLEMQESKAMSALKVISDSPELHCKDSSVWCIDKDKLIAFSEYSYLYHDFYSVASIEILMVYPFRDKNFLNPLNTFTQKQVIDCPGNHGDKTGDGFSNRPIDSVFVVHSLSANQGPLNHLPPVGDSLRPQLIYDNLNVGERIKLQGIFGEINFGHALIDCRENSQGSGPGFVLGGFYSSSDQLVQEYDLIHFEDIDGIEVPSGAKKFYVYVREDDNLKGTYSENSGSCSFSIKKLGWETCYTSQSSLSSPASNRNQLILCPQPNCDYYVLFDSNQKNKLTYSAYINVCQTIDRSYESCELAKLMLGVKIPENF